MFLLYTLEVLGVSRGPGFKGGLGGSVNLEERKNFLAASRDEGSKSVVGVLFLGLHTIQLPGRGVFTVGGVDLTSNSEVLLSDPDPKTVMS